MPDQRMKRPTASSPQVARFMSGLRRTGTKPELELRRELHRRGVRFRVDVRGLPGRPDVVLTRARVAIFVDGCFWHACSLHGVTPKSNRRWWAEKLAANVDRDRRTNLLLQDDGWLVFRVWEHDDPIEAADRIVAAWLARTGRSINLLD